MTIIINIWCTTGQRKTFSRLWKITRLNCRRWKRLDSWRPLNRRSTAGRDNYLTFWKQLKCCSQFRDNGCISRYEQAFAHMLICEVDCSINRFHCWVNGSEVTKYIYTELYYHSHFMYVSLVDMFHSYLFVRLSMTLWKVVRHSAKDSVSYQVIAKTWTCRVCVCVCRTYSLVKILGVNYLASRLNLMISTTNGRW